MAPQAIEIAQNGLGNDAGLRSVQKEDQAKPVFQRGGDEVDKMEDKLGRLDTGARGAGAQIGQKRPAKASHERSETKPASSP